MICMVALWLSLRKAIFRLIPISHLKPIPQTFCRYNSSNHFCIILLFYRFILLSMVNSTRKYARLVLSCRLAASIDNTSSLLSKSSCVRLSAPILLISHQDQQISTLHVSPNSLALIFHKCLFYTLSDVLAYIQNFLIDRDCVYVYKNVVKQVGTIFELGSAFASGLARAIKKDKF